MDPRPPPDDDSEDELLKDRQTLRLLIAAGFITLEKVNQARALIDAPPLTE